MLAVVALAGAVFVTLRLDRAVVTFGAPMIAGILRPGLAVLPERHALTGNDRRHPLDRNDQGEHGNGDDPKDCGHPQQLYAVR